MVKPSQNHLTKSLAVTCAVLGLLGPVRTTAAGDKPNFVVILTDDQSWVGSSLQIIPGDARTRSDYFRTPHIERLAAMGMRFTQGYLDSNEETEKTRAEVQFLKLQLFIFK